MTKSVRSFHAASLFISFYPVQFAANLLTPLPVLRTERGQQGVHKQVYPSIHQKGIPSAASTGVNV